MNPLEQPFFATLKARLDIISERQKLISENVANATTPGFKPRDVDASAFEKAVSAAAARQNGSRLQMARTQASHMPTGALTGTGPKVITRPDSETTIDGNAVVLEEQMLRAAQNRSAFETGMAIYQKGLQLMRMAARGPGR